MEELRLLVDFTGSPELATPKARETCIRETIDELRREFGKKDVTIVVLAPYEYDETIVNNSKLSNWAEEIKEPI